MHFEGTTWAAVAATEEKEEEEGFSRNTQNQSASHVWLTTRGPESAYFLIGGVSIRERRVGKINHSNRSLKINLDFSAFLTRRLMNPEGFPKSLTR